MKRSKGDANVEHMGWVVKCRSRNHHASLELFTLLKNYSEQLKKDTEIVNAAISLVAISFSLWRAVFLADRKGGDTNRFEDATLFLEKLILDNAIAYAQDRNSREWTFQYYLNNAGFRLEGISRRGPSILPNFSRPPQGTTGQDAWEHYQNSLEVAIGNCANALKTSGVRKARARPVPKKG